MERKNGAAPHRNKILPVFYFEIADIRDQKISHSGRAEADIETNIRLQIGYESITVPDAHRRTVFEQRPQIAARPGGAYPHRDVVVREVIPGPGPILPKSSTKQITKRSWPSRLPCIAEAGRVWCVYLKHGI